MSVPAISSVATIAGSVQVDPWGLVFAPPSVRRSEVAAAISVLQQIPEADRAALIQAGIRIQLLPQARLENDRVGATDIADDASGRTHPQGIRIAAHAGMPLSPTNQIVAHEIGHAIEVLRRQDKSELAAENYVLRVLRSGADQALAGQRMRRQGMPAPPSFAPPGLYGALVQVV